MRFFDGLFGNESQKSYFSSLMTEGKLSHAYILEAPAGSGKKMFARLLAAALTDGGDDPEREGKCKRILDGNSPDVLTLTREENKRTIGVEAVRDFCASVYLTPSELDFKMYIFDEADKITPQAQNALLKIIEEPPRGVYMFLLCENALNLLSTVRSRAQKVTLEQFTPERLAFFAKKEELSGAEDPEKLMFAARMAEGSIGKLIGLLQEADAEFLSYTAAKRIVNAQLKKGRGVTYFDFLKELSDHCSTREALDGLTKFLLTAYGDLSRAKHAETLSVSFFDPEEAEKISLFMTDETVMRSFEAVDGIRRDMQYHTSLSLSAAKLAMELWQAS